MKKILFSFLPLCLISLYAFMPPAELPIGSSMPNATLKLKDVTGKELSLSDAKKQNGLLVMFSCNTCPYVIKNQHRTKEIAAYTLNKNVGVILINSNEAQRSNEDSYEAMKTYAAEQGYKWAYVMDDATKMADAFGASRTPECYLFDKDGKLVYHGAIDDNPTDENAVGRTHLKNAIDEMLAGKPVSVTTSRSVGCTIKRKA